MHTALEQFFNENGTYPAEDQIITVLDTNPNVNSNQYTDSQDRAINEADSHYTYRGFTCTPAGCSSYLLTSLLSDGTTYNKNSLNTGSNPDA